ncbi:MAG TPA: sigma factor-like helix-turn-helix DNA-binding protein, partial [Polyangiales bacterium]|nr:sigma factor-like helix-turn-helix DNA-binding protein [Polyangiales bacterium]
LRASRTLHDADATMQEPRVRARGSLHEADDAVHETSLRACCSPGALHDADGAVQGTCRSQLKEIANVPAWLTTIVSRVCLDLLRARRRRAEETFDMHDRAPSSARDPEDELSWVQDVGSALLVVMDTLGPAERIAFVLHDLLGQPFEEIAHVVERTPAAAKKLASRARARVLARPSSDPALLAREHSVVAAFLRAARQRDVDGMLAVLAPDVVRRTNLKGQLVGAQNVSRESLRNTKSARMAELVSIAGRPALIVAPRGRLAIALCFAVSADRIATMDVITDAAELRKLPIRLFALTVQRPSEITRIS